MHISNFITPLQSNSILHTHPRYVAQPQPTAKPRTSITHFMRNPSHQPRLSMCTPQQGDGQLSKDSHVDHLLKRLNCKTTIMSKELMDDLLSISASDGILYNTGQREISLLTLEHQQNIQAISNSAEIQQAEQATLVGEGCGVLLIGSNAPETLVKRTIEDHFLCSSFCENLWENVKPNCEWTTRNLPTGEKTQSIAKGAQILPLAVIHDAIATEILSKTQANTFTQMLRELYLTGLVACEQGTISKEELESLRENVVENAKDTFNLHTKELKDEAPHLAKLIQRTRSRFTLQLRLDMLRQSNSIQTNSKSTQSEHTTSPEGNWFPSEVITSLNTYNPENAVHLQHINGQPQGHIGLQERDMPLLVIKPNTSTEAIQSFLSKLCGNLLPDTPEQLQDFAAPSWDPSSTESQFVSVSDLRKEVQNAFWLTVASDPEVQQAKEALKTSENYFFTFPEEAKTALSNNFKMKFQEAMHNAFEMHEQPLLVMNSDHHLNMCERVMATCLSITEANPIRLIRDLRVAIDKEFS